MYKSIHVSSYIFVIFAHLLVLAPAPRTGDARKVQFAPLFAKPTSGQTPTDFALRHPASRYAKGTVLKMFDLKPVRIQTLVLD